MTNNLVVLPFKNSGDLLPKDLPEHDGVLMFYFKKKDGVVAETPTMTWDRFDHNHWGMVFMMIVDYMITVSPKNLDIAISNLQKRKAALEEAQAKQN